MKVNRNSLLALALLVAVLFPDRADARLRMDYPQYYDTASDYTVFQGGDTIENAPTLTSPAKIRGTTVGYANDYQIPCPTWTSESADVAYMISVTESAFYTFNLIGSLFDTQLFLADAEEYLLTCDSDFHGGGDSCILDYWLEPGQYYLIIDGGYYEDGSEGQYFLHLYHYPELSPYACAGLPQENEPVVTDLYGFENINSGFNGEFTPLATEICGDFFTFNPEFGAPLRDTDHYAFDLTQQGIITVYAYSTLDFVIELAAGVSENDVLGHEMGRGLLSVRSECLQPGTYIIATAPQFFAGIETPVGYHLSVSVEECPAGWFCEDVPVLTSADTEVAGSNYHDLNHIGNPAGDAIYALEVDEAVELTIDLCSSWVEFDTYLRVYDGCPDTGSQIAFNDNGPLGYCPEAYTEIPPSKIENLLLAPGLYYIVVEGNGNSEGFFYLNLEWGTPDPCDHATPVNCGDTVGGSTIGAFNWFGHTSGDALYTLTPEENLSVWFSLCDSDQNFDTYLSLYRGCPSEGVLLESNDDSCGLQSYLSANLWAGVEYWLVVEGYGVSEGDYILEVGGCTSLSACDVAIELNCGDLASGDTQYAADWGGTIAHDSPYVFTPESDVTATFSLCHDGTNYDTILNLYQGCEIVPENLIASNDDACDYQSEIVVELTGGTEYLLLVTGYAVNDIHYWGQYELSLSCVEDPCDIGIALTCGDVVTGSTVGAQNYYDTLSGDVLYTYTPSFNVAATFSLCSPNTTFDTQLALFDGCPGEGGQLIDLNDDFCEGSSQIQHNLWAGNEYWLVVNGSNESAEGEFELSLSCTILSACNFGVEMNCGGVYTGNTVGGPDWVFQDAADDLYTFTPDHDTFAVFSLCNPGTDFNTFMILYEGCPSSGGQALTMNNDTCGEYSLVDHDLTAGVEYWLLVTGYHEAEGNYELTVDCQIDYCFDLPVILVGDAVTGTTLGKEDILGSEASDVFYELLVEEAGEVTVSLCGSNFRFNTDLYLYDACPTVGTEIAHNDDFCGIHSQFTTQLEAGVYIIWITGVNNSRGNYTLEVSASVPPPAAPLNLRIMAVVAPNGEILAQINWDPVNTDVNGDPLLVSGYKLYVSGDPFSENYTLAETYDADISEGILRFTDYGLTSRAFLFLVAVADDGQAVASSDPARTQTKPSPGLPVK
jgi:hypothetical protein